jgi:SAM-dependent methyltransferase
VVNLIRRWIRGIAKLLGLPAPFHARLAQHPLFRLLLRAADLPGRLLYPEFRDLPPNDLRVRVGVKGRLLNNEPIYLTRGVDLWMYLLSRGLADLDSDVLEIGSGCGRRTHFMRDFRFHDTRYTGRYLGVDIDPEMLSWCRAHFDSERFTFVESTHASEAYGMHLDRGGADYYRLPVDDATVDLVFGTSVFTHLLEEQVVNYLQESFRVLRPGGHVMMTCKLLDLNPDLGANRYPHRVGNAYVEDRARPETAVAYESEFMVTQVAAAGFTDVELHHAPGDPQQAFIARRARTPKTPRDSKGGRPA